MIDLNPTFLEESPLRYWDHLFSPVEAVLSLQNLKREYFINLWGLDSTRTMVLEDFNAPLEAGLGRKIVQLLIGSP